MNSETTYTILLSKEYLINGRPYPLLGFSYRIFKVNDLLKAPNDDGTITEFQKDEVWIEEHGHPTKIILWDKDGPELADLTEQMVKERIEEVLS